MKEPTVIKFKKRPVKFKTKYGTVQFSMLSPEYPKHKTKREWKGYIILDGNGKLTGVNFDNDMRSGFMEVFYNKPVALDYRREGEKIIKVRITEV